MAGRDVYAYFDNDVKKHAPIDAISLRKRLAQIHLSARSVSSTQSGRWSEAITAVGVSGNSMRSTEK